MNYIILICVPTFLYIIESKIKTDKTLFEKAGIIFLVLFSSRRVDVGVDYDTYRRAFQNFSQGMFGYDSFEPGFLLLNKIVINLGGSFHDLLFLIALINSVFLYLSLKQLKELRWLALFAYLSYFDLYIYSLSAIRQSIAINIIMFSMRYIKSGDISKYMVLVLIATSFHWTAAMMLPFYFIYRYMTTIDLKKNLTYLIETILFYAIGINTLIAFGSFFSYKIYYYLVLDSTNNAIDTNVIVALGYIVLLFIWMMFVYKYPLMNGKQTITVYELSISFFLVLKVWQNIKYLGALPRFQMYFYCLLPFAIVLFIMRFKGNTKIYIIMLVAILLLVQLYLKIRMHYDFYGEFNIVW